MDIIEEFKNLSDFIKEQSAANREKAETYNDYYSKGLHEGYADAYELCAKWIDKRIKEAYNHEN